MRNNLLFIYFIITTFSVAAQDTASRDLSKITTSTYLEDTASHSKWGVKAGGYISTDLFWDTRVVVESRDGVLCLYPENVQKDINGKDINARPSFNFLALNTRISLRVQVPDALGARVSGMVEGWFAGMSNNDMNGFSMRHAFIKLDWESGTSLLMGQTWHPLFTEDCFANTIAGSAGAPFQPFSRAPQIRLTQGFGYSSKTMLYINTQRDFLSFGSAGNSSSYLRNSVIPEMGLQYIYNQGSNATKCRDPYRTTLLGIGVDYKYLIPRVVTDSNVYTRNGLHAFTAIAFIYCQRYITRNILFGVKAKALYGQACNEFLLLGGYAYRYYDNQPLDPRINYTYTSINTAAAWLDICVFKMKKGEKEWEVGLFGGYTQNLGSNKRIQDCNNTNSYFSRGYNIQNLYRISARTAYKVKSLQFGIEPEYTAAVYSNMVNAYGLPQKKSDFFPDAKINHVGNLRILLNATLYF